MGGNFGAFSDLGVFLTFSFRFRLGEFRYRSTHPRRVFESRDDSSGSAVWTDSGYFWFGIFVHLMDFRILLFSYFLLV